jgi:hypothetical protein
MNIENKMNNISYRYLREWQSKINTIQFPDKLYCKDIHEDSIFYSCLEKFYKLNNLEIGEFDYYTVDFDKENDSDILITVHITTPKKVNISINFNKNKQ